MKSTQQRAIGHFQVAFLALAVVLLVASAAGAAERKKEIYVVHWKSPSVAVIDSEQWQVAATIPIEKYPTHGAVGPQNRFLYVLHNGLFGARGGWPEAPKIFDLHFPPPGGWGWPKGPSMLSVLDLGTRQVVKTIPLGWGVSRVGLSEDERYLIFFAQGRPRKLKPESDAELGRLTVIDTQSNEVVFSTDHWPMGLGIVWTQDASRIFVLGVREFAKKRYTAFSKFPDGNPWTQSVLLRSKLKMSRNFLTVFKDRGEKPVAEIELDPGATEMVLSQDQRWLYIPDPGTDSKKKHNATVHVVDVESCQLVASRDLGYPAKVLVSLPLSGGAVVKGVPAGGTDEQPKVHHLVGSPLLPPGETTPWLKELGSSLIASIRIPNQNRLAALTLDHRLGIVNLEENRLERVVKIGRGGVRLAKAVGVGALVAGSIAFAGGLVGLAFEVAAIQALATPTLHLLLATPDGKFLYVLDTSSNDVTIVDSEDGSVVDHIAVGGDCEGLVFTPDGKAIWAVARTRLTLIDTTSNKQRFQREFAPELGRRHDWNMVRENGRILLLFDNQLQACDPEQAGSLATIKGLSEARLVVLPREGK